MDDIDIINLQYFDPQGRISSAYVIRTWFSMYSDNNDYPSTEDFVDGLYCARNKEDAFKQMFEDFAKSCPERKIEKFELLRINGGIENRKPIV
jgi:hypothetical protein